MKYQKRDLATTVLGAKIRTENNHVSKGPEHENTEETLTSVKLRGRLLFRWKQPSNDLVLVKTPCVGYSLVIMRVIGDRPASKEVRSCR